jgi:Asp-tRNA(Asn)/Glu-tRNA(Gln) amidotransferase A subunit family amidase
VVETVHDAARRFETLGAHVEEPTLGFEVDAIWDAFLVISDSDRHATLGQQLYDDPSTRCLLSPYVRERFARGRQLTAVEYSLALRARFRFIQQLERVFQKYDLILTPTIAMVAPSLAELPTSYVPRALIDYVPYNFIVNFAGATAASIPCGFVGGLPIGLQVIARPNHEHTVLRASRALERARPWANDHPTMS